MRRPSRLRQRGAVIITVALMLLFLLGFMGIALDFGRAFVVQSELQTAMDSCALAAAQELDGAADATTRATNAGLAAGNVNRVQMQSPTWDGQGQLVSAEITFRDTNYVQTANPATARYAQCSHQQSNIQPWLFGAMAMFSGSDSWGQPLVVGAHAVATRGNAQSACPLPLALTPKHWSDDASNNYGYAVGDWITLLTGTNTDAGWIGWANLDGSQSAKTTTEEMNGYCGTQVGDTLKTQGVEQAVADNWNYRFGIYRNPTAWDPTDLVKRPDYTGFSYTPATWPAGRDAFGDFEQKRIAYQAYSGANIPSFNKILPGGVTTGGYYQYGRNRRVAVVPVVNGAFSVQGWACMLMLEPMRTPPAAVRLEFRGLAGAPGSPCTTGGIPGGNAGPLVPVLVE